MIFCKSDKCWTKRTERKRADIVQAAAEEFEKKGFQATSMDRIASRAKVSKRTVYNHFDSKEKLFLAIAGEVWSQAHEATDISYQEGAPLFGQLKEMADRKVNLLLSPDFMGLFRVMLSECIRSPELARETFQNLQSGEEGFLQWIHAASADGKLKVDNPEIAAEQFWGLIKPPLLWPGVMGKEKQLDNKKIEEIITSGIGVWLKAYAVGK